jgi:hypothetical protein
MLAAAHEDDVFAVGGNRKAGELLPIILLVVRQAAGLVVRRGGGIDIAAALLIHGPGEVGARGGEFIGERISLDLLKREGRLGKKIRGQEQQSGAHGIGIADKAGKLLFRVD